MSTSIRINHKLLALLLLALSFLLSHGLRVASRQATARVHFALYSNEGASLVFGGVKFHAPISDSLALMGIDEPSPIQAASLVAITTGLSCILHAETGSGKTLAYLLPLLKRLYAGGTLADKRPLQALIIVPTRELAVQVAADIAALLSGKQTDKPIAASDSNNNNNNNNNIDCSMVHLCINSARGGLEKITAPIVVGTPFKVLDLVNASPASSLSSLNYLVLDEVDRLLSVLGRYATSEDRRSMRDSEKPAEDLIAKIISHKATLLRQQQQQKPAPPPPLGTLEGLFDELGLQVVAASATVGRPMRRDLYRILQGGVRSSRSAGELPVLRAAVSSSAADLAGDVEVKEEPREIASTNSEGNEEEDEELGAERGGETRKTNAMARKVGVPASIRHVAVLVQDDSIEFNTKLAAARKLWAKDPSVSRGLLFVPFPDDVKQALGMLQFWGVKEARNLQQALGIETVRPLPQQVQRLAPGVWRSGGGEKKDGRGSSSKMGAATAEAKKKAADVPLAEPHRRLSSAEMVLKAAQSRIGSTARFLQQAQEQQKQTPDGIDIDQVERELFVVPVSGTRGLHLQDIEHVLVLQPPRTMDEYLHMAGRTGRRGSKKSTSIVFSLVNYDELKRLQSWQTPLGIEFDVQYEQ